MKASGLHIVCLVLVLATVNAWIRGSKKNVAKCDTQRDVRNLVNQRNFERYMRE